jgi:hypothetical protein
VTPPGASATLWTGWDPMQGTASALPAALLERKPGVVDEVVFELLAVAGRGFRPPRYLTVAGPHPRDGAAGEDGATTSDGALRRTWSVVYHRIAETAPAAVAPYAIYLLGVNPPEGATHAELETFNDFYTNVHLREVAARRHALRAVRYERARVLLPPPKGAPRFLAVYEVDEKGAAQRRHVGPPYSAGPEIWQRHTTPWRLWYRRITP